MAKILQNPEHHAQLGYDGFPMDQLLKFSSTTGELRPVYYDILYPGDKVTCSSILKTRTMDLSTAAMCNIEEHIEWFAVPLVQIYCLFSQWYYGIDDLHTSFVNRDDLDGTLLPYIPAEDFSRVYHDLQLESDFYFPQPNLESTASGVNIGSSLRLMEDLGIPLHQYEPSGGSLPVLATMHMGLFPVLACAYQKIYFDYYRITDRELGQPSSYNLDDLYSILNIRNDTRIKSMFRMRYRPRVKDFFTHVYVSPLFNFSDSQGFGSNNVSASPSELFQRWLAPGEPTLGHGNDIAIVSTSTTSVSSQQDTNIYLQPASASSAQSLAYNINTASLRSLFATEKFLEITRRSAKHIDAQTLAHFGVSVPKRVAGEVIFLGGDHSSINIGDVIATNSAPETATSRAVNLGEIGGKGYNFSKSKQIKFTNEGTCPCVLMAIYSANPSYDYLPLGLDKFWTYMDQSSWFRPEFDNMGLQPLFQYQSFLAYQDSSAAEAYNGNVLGWQFRWMESKCKYNRITGSLARSLRYWTTSRTFADASLQNFLVSPFDLNNIMLVPYNFDAAYDEIEVAYESGDQFTDAFANDPLIHELYFDVKKASKMNAFGLVNL